MDCFPALLSYCSQTLGVAGDCNANLFFEFSEGGIEQRLAVLNQAFGNRPGSKIAVGPVRASRIDKEYFDYRLLAVRKYASALCTHPLFNS